MPRVSETEADDCINFKASLGYRGRYCQQIAKKKKKFSDSVSEMAHLVK